jgi:phosphoserine phosphatase RsbX
VSTRIRASGVGNVELRCLAGALSMPLNPGILGHRVRRHVELQGALTRGERIAVFSDGIAGRLDLAEHRHLDPDDACRAILARHGRPYDDASIVIIDVGA